MQAYDIEIPVDDIALKGKMSTIHSFANGELTKQVAVLDEEVTIPQYLDHV